jgi:uncharacterized protein
LEYLFVLCVGLIAGTLSGIVGFGSSIMLMPVLVIAFGPLQAVPIMAIAAIMGNLSRILVWWRDVDWRACAAYSVTGVPAAALGAKTLGVLPLDAIIKGLITGSSLTAGSFIAKRFVLRLDPERFRLLMDGLMLVSGIAMLWTAAVPRQVAG